MIALAGFLKEFGNVTEMGAFRDEDRRNDPDDGPCRHVDIPSVTIMQ